MEQVELRPCPAPWCEATEREGDFTPQVINSNFGTHYVACTSCSLHGPYRRNRVSAIEAWNTRPNDQAKDEEIARLREALEPFVSGAGHTMTFLRTREKMHSAGQELYMEDVRRARAVLEQSCA